MVGRALSFVIILSLAQVGEPSFAGAPLSADVCGLKCDGSVYTSKAEVPPEDIEPSQPTLKAVSWHLYDEHGCKNWEEEKDRAFVGSFRSRDACQQACDNSSACDVCCYDGNNFQRDWWYGMKWCDLQPSLGGKGVKVSVKVRPKEMFDNSCADVNVFDGECTELSLSDTGYVSGKRCLPGTDCTDCGNCPVTGTWVHKGNGVCDNSGEKALDYIHRISLEGCQQACALQFANCGSIAHSTTKPGCYMYSFDTWGCKIENGSVDSLHGDQKLWETYEFYASKDLEFDRLDQVCNESLDIFEYRDIKTVVWPVRENPGWTMGSRGQTCTEACTERHLKCNKEMLEQLQTTDGLKKVVEEHPDDMFCVKYGDAKSYAYQDGVGGWCYPATGADCEGADSHNPPYNARYCYCDSGDSETVRQKPYNSIQGETSHLPYDNRLQGCSNAGSHSDLADKASPIAFRALEDCEKRCDSLPGCLVCAKANDEFYYALNKCVVNPYERWNYMWIKARNAEYNENSCGSESYGVGDTNDGVCDEKVCLPGTECSDCENCPVTGEWKDAGAGVCVNSENVPLNTLGQRRTYSIEHCKQYCSSNFANCGGIAYHEHTDDDDLAFSNSVCLLLSASSTPCTPTLNAKVLPDIKGYRTMFYSNFRDSEFDVLDRNRDDALDRVEFRNVATAEYPPKPRTLGWFQGLQGESCDDVCTSHGSKCVLGTLSWMHTEERIRGIVEADDSFSCDSYADEDSYHGNASYPYQQFGQGKCYYIGTPTGQVSCSGSEKSRNRFCFCNTHPELLETTTVLPEKLETTTVPPEKLETTTVPSEKLETTTVPPTTTWAPLKPSTMAPETTTTDTTTTAPMTIAPETAEPVPLTTAAPPAVVLCGGSCGFCEPESQTCQPTPSTSAFPLTCGQACAADNDCQISTCAICSPTEKTCRGKRWEILVPGSITLYTATSFRDIDQSLFLEAFRNQAFGKFFPGNILSLTNIQNQAVTGRRLASEGVTFDIEIDTPSEEDASTAKTKADAVDSAALTTDFKTKLQDQNIMPPIDLAAETKEASEPSEEQPATSTPSPLVVIDACFPGDAAVHVKGRGPTMMADLAIGDLVLVSRSGIHLFESVLSFLHAFRGSKNVRFNAVRHEKGEIRATPGHILLTTGGDKPLKDIMPGDLLLTAGVDGSPSTSVVFAVTEAEGVDAYAPLTAAGTIVVENVVASNYASPGTLGVRHAVAHALLFPVRAYHALGLQVQSNSAGEELHPFLDVVFRKFRLDKLHAVLLGSK